MLVGKDVSPVKFIRLGIGARLIGIIIITFINSPKTKFIVHVLCALQSPVIKVSVVKMHMDIVLISITRFLICERFSDLNLVKRKI